MMNGPSKGVSGFRSHLSSYTITCIPDLPEDNHQDDVVLPTETGTPTQVFDIGNVFTMFSFNIQGPVVM